MAESTWYRGDTVKEHSINFGNLSGNKIVGANTWDNWHLIPSSRPSISHPPFATKYVEIPGANGYVDLSDYLIGRPVYGARTGSLSFVVDNDHENWETIRSKIVRFLHGKRMKMQLTDDPDYFYDGRFTVGNWESGQARSSISISYQLMPYKYDIDVKGNEDIIWDTFNFETGYDYYPICHNCVVTTTMNIDIIDDSEFIMLSVEGVSGTVTASYGGITKQVTTGVTQELGTTYGGTNVLTLSGNGTVNVSWRGAVL